MDCAETFRLVFDGLLVFWTFVLSIVTIFLVRETRKGARKQLEVSTWLSFTSRFGASEMERARSTLANEIHQSQQNNPPSDFSEPVLEFFEQVGIAYEQGCIHKKLCHSAFSYDAQNWWRWAKPIVEKMRAQRGEKDLYCDFENFIALMKADFPNDPDITTEKADKYLRLEMGRWDWRENRSFPLRSPS